MEPSTQRPGPLLPLRRATRTPFSPRGVALAVALPGVATLVGLAAGRSSTKAASLYFLAVAGAAALGGLWSGVAAAVLSFLGLNYYFTVPFHTFRVQKAEDLVALAVFVVVAMLVGALVAGALLERDRAERREAETRLLNQLATRLLAGTAFDVLLRDVVHILVRLFRLSGCAVELRVGPDTLREEVTGGAEPGGTVETLEVPLLIEGGPDLGRLRVERAAAFGQDERHLLETFAGQLALAAGRATADAEARGARLEAETSQLRAALFSSVTHDLRTPLSSIKASVTSLLDSAAGHGAEDRGELLRTILEETDRLNRLVGNLLDLARMRAGALTPNRQPLGVDEVIEAAVARMQGLLAGFRVQVHVRPNLPEAWIDPVQVDQVISNLLENAVRFSPPGSAIRISVWSWQSTIEVKVSDQGPGIPAEDRDRVFEPFYRRDAGLGRGGTGLGLAIVRAVVVAHGGDVRIEGTPGGGTSVVLRLPTAAPSTTTKEPQREVRS
jgi:two-component system, OmpR family, sensor histidine kinase KdpD